MNVSLNQVQSIGTGLAFIVFPLVFIFAFAVHPGLLKPHLLSPSELIHRAHHAVLLQFAHVLVMLNTALLIVAAFHFMRILGNTSVAWAGFVGGALAILGAIVLAADKGALCLTMSAFDELSENEFSQIMPGVMAMFNKQGWLVLLWGILLLPIGFAVQAIALFKADIFPVWQFALFLVSVLLIGVPDGIEVVNLTASVLMAIAFVPYGMQMIVSAAR